MGNIDISLDIDDAFAPQLRPEPIKKALLTTFELFSDSSLLGGGYTLAVTITDNETVRQLNRRYRDSDAPTDVLSFENTPDPDFPDPEQVIAQHLGDIVIAYPIAEAQAARAGHRPLDEVVLLAVHGALHLLGFDHDTAGQKEEMWGIQHQIITRLGLAHVQPTES
jgi:probable rRNA maturation factor